MNIAKEMGQLSLILAVALGHMSCKDDNPANSNGDPDEITWQQTPLDSVTSLTHSLAINSLGHIFVGDGGVFRSKDHGETWTNILDTFGPRSIVISPDDHIFAAKNSALMRSLDGGQTWELLLILSYSLSIIPMAFDDTGTLYVGSVLGDESIGGVLRSEDNGDTWIKTSLPDSIGVGELVLDGNGDIFAGTDLGVLRSSDKGETWVESNTGLKNLPVNALAINSKNSDMYVDIHFDALYRSTDNGQTWNSTSLSKPFITAIVFNSENHIFVATGTYSTGIQPEGVYYSRDNGESWNQINQGLSNLNVFSLLVDSQDYLYAATFDIRDASGVFRSVNPTIQ